MRHGWNHSSENLAKLGGLTDWGGKLAGAVARIAGLLHMAGLAGRDVPWSIAISQTTVEHAIAIGRYLIPHAKAAFAVMGTDPTAEKAKKILRWIEHDGLDSFSRRDAHQSMRSTFRRPEELEAPLAVLVDREFIRKRFAPAREAAGRPPSPAFDVNPLWLRRHEKTASAGDLGNSEYFEHCETAQGPEGDNLADSAVQPGLE